MSIPLAITPIVPPPSAARCAAPSIPRANPETTVCPASASSPANCRASLIAAAEALRAPTTATQGRARRMLAPMSQIIVTAVGPDRPGIVADLSKLVHDSGANIEGSRMVNLRGHFALLALVEGPDGSPGAFVSDGFGVVHRKQASVYDVASILPHYAGTLVATEVKVLEQLTSSTERPYAVRRFCRICTAHASALRSRNTARERYPINSALSAATALSLQAL